MHTVVRDTETTKHDFVFYADRLIRLVVEYGLGQLPFTEKQIITLTGSVLPELFSANDCVAFRSVEVGKVWETHREPAARESKLEKT